MSLRNEERIKQLFQPIGDLATCRDQRVWNLLVPKSSIDELRDNANERAEQAEATREAERKAKESKRAAEKASKAAQARIIAETARECAASAAKKAPRRGRMVAVFTPEQISAAEKAAALQPEERHDRLKPILAEIKRDDGYRSIPSLRSLDRRLGVLRQKFENLSVAIDRLGAELALASAMRSVDFRVTPLLLVGEPGLGKTYFARSLAKAVGVDMEIVSAGGSQSGFALVGLSNQWSNTQPGGVAKLLARSRHATPVLVIDEVDKIAGDDRFPVLPALLDLLEPGTARTFKDESLDLRMDASKLIVVLTANELDFVPAPLKSRVEVIRVPRPDVVLRLRIIEGEWAELRKHSRRKIELASGMAQVLAEREDLDLRKTTRIVRDAFATALLRKEPVARLDLPAPPRVKVIGFGGGS